ncbi:hypothetical protein MNJPNG_18840 [Cupriavidus oxalaticus]|uniref:hypothetical protein n=1 Tax=Cupriavidus oxalaticus TaxID=96344 RepID=UPI003F73ABE5
MKTMPRAAAVAIACCRMVACAAVLLGCGVQVAHAAPAASGALSDAVLACGGHLEATTWHLWDTRGLPFAQQRLVGERLTREGDTYALYDLEIYFHNLLAMAQRCGREARQRQIAMLVSATYAQLAPAPGGRSGRAWVCRGGKECTNSDSLRNTEVMLNSTQYMAFASSLANGMRRDTDTLFSRNFIDLTARIAREHLLRWNTPAARESLRKRIAARPADVKNTSSSLFLTDRDLWQVAIYADLAGMMEARPGGIPPAGDAELASMQEHLGLLLQLFATRTTQRMIAGADGKQATVAEIDAGFWRLYDDHRYAGYVGEEKPVVCRRDPKHRDANTVETRIPADGIAPVDGVGWDISHARRLVHVFDAIERNRGALSRVFGVAPAALPAAEVPAAFARQLRMRVWNRDRDQPLFANYYSGANGWYRVNYDNGTGYCMEGYPPYGLSESFPAGGYASWGQLRELGIRVYALTQSRQERDRAYLRTYYPGLAEPGTSRGMLVQLMFWPSLVGTAGSR